MKTTFSVDTINFRLYLRWIVSKKGAVANLSSFNRKISLLFLFFLNYKQKYAYKPNFIKNYLRLIFFWTLRVLWSFPKCEKIVLKVIKSKNMW